MRNNKTMMDANNSLKSGSIDEENPPYHGQLADKEKRIRHLQLYRAALNDDWNRAKDIFRNHEEDKTAIITKEGDTLLHVAAKAESSNFAEKLFNEIKNVQHFYVRNKNNNTAFCLAAATGKVKLAEQMMVYENLVTVRGSEGMLPIVMAALFGQKDMVHILYKATKNKLTDEDGIELLVTLIDEGFYDVALDLLKEKPKLATCRNTKEETALHALARMPVKASNLANLNRQGIFKRCFKRCINNFRHKKLPPEALELVKRLWKEVISEMDDLGVSKFVCQPFRLIFVAAKCGNIEFLTILIREYPDLIFKVDGKRYTIFHHAVLNRQNDIFRLIHEAGPIKYLIAPSVDTKKNNMLHLAGMLAPSDRLNIVSGAALQLQRELLWFEEVQKIMHVADAEVENKKKETPRALFTKEHEKLKEEGERWMKETAQSCMIVATLIATMVFAAAFALPGGTKEDTGTPHFLRKASFTVFAISDAISLVSSSCSILTFLSILTSRYAEDDFKWWLPTKLLIGIGTLFISLVSMMVVFCATFFIVFNDAKLWHAVLAAVIVPIPIICFICLHWNLLHDLWVSTFSNSSLFKPRSHTLFCDEGKATESKKRKYAV